MRGLPEDTPFAWRAWLGAYPVYLGAATFVSGSVVRYLLLLFPAALLVARVARWPWGRIAVVACWTAGLGLQGVWVAGFVVPAQGLIP